MAKARIKFINQGFKDIMFSSGTYNLLKELGEKRAQKAGPGYAVQMERAFGGSRWMAYVYAATDEANKDEAENKTLSRSVRT